MRQVGDRPLWVGHAGDLLDPRAVLAAGVEAVVELADSDPLADLPRDLIRCWFPLSDSGANPAWLVQLAVAAVAALVHAEVGVLVACSGGMSRSVGVAAGGLAVATGRPFAEVLAAVTRSGPVDLAPGFAESVRQAVDRLADRTSGR